MGQESAWGLDVVQRHSTTDQVLGQLRAAILAGRMSPGEPLRETTLAAVFGTGRSAIREALRQLVQEGLVVAEHNRGARVRPITIADVVDLYRTRAAVEVAAVSIVLELPGDLDLRALRDVQDRLRDASPDDCQEPPSPELIAADIDFHRVMVGLAASPRLSRAHEPLAAESQMLLNRHPSYSGSDYAADHQQLLDAIEARDPETPEIVRAHLELSSDLIAGEMDRVGWTEQANWEREA